MPNVNQIDSVGELGKGRPVDLADFALARWWTGTEGRDLHIHEIQRDAGGLRPGQDPQTGEWHLGLEWSEPRDICRVVVAYGQGDAPPDIRVQYWQKNWPTPAPERWPGARRGWIGRDDPWHGQWITARGEEVITGSTFSINFDPIDLPELGGRDAAVRLNEAEHYRARFRRTLKLRLVSGGDEQPLIAGIHAYAPVAWQEVEVEVYLGYGQGGAGDWSGQVQLYNGHLLRLEPLGFESEDRLETTVSWRCQVQNQPKGVRLRLLFVPGDIASADGTVVTMHSQKHSFSFLVADLERGPIYIKDYGVFITPAGVEADLGVFQTKLATAPKAIYDRVFDEPEQSLARATAEIPPPDLVKQAPFGRYMVLGLETGRQEFALRYNGELFGDKRFLKLMGRDAARLQWPGYQLRFRFGTGDPPDFRERWEGTRQRILEEWLPVVISEWLDREIEYKQTVFVAHLNGPMPGPEEGRGDEDIVALVRFAIRNTTPGHKRARLWLVVVPQEQLELKIAEVSLARPGGAESSAVYLALGLGRVVPAEPVARQWRVDAYEAACLRCAIHTGGRGKLTAVNYAETPGESQAVLTAVAYDLDLAGGEGHTITLAFPFASLTQAEGWQKVAAVDYETKLADVVSYWRQYVEAGGQLDLPDKVFGAFHKAVRVHVGLSADKDVATGLIVVPAGGWSYGACGNEACWQITMLDQAGHHERAEAYLETFLRTQGWLGLDGNFATTEGVLQGIDLDEGRPVQSHFSYNTDHGFIMECLAHHYRYSGDRAWLERVTPQLIAACDFVIRERESTKSYDTAGQPRPEWGLMPAGHLEDNPEWRYWFAVNAHAYSGLKAVAEVLGEVGHPEAERLRQAAEAYRTDIRAAARRAMIEAPVVRLLDGSYIPHIPTRAMLRGREWGWFREAAYGALHLLEGDVFEPNEPEMTWVLKDLEDNLFGSREWGRPVDLERYWFSHGGVTIQPSLTDLAIDYLRRGQPKHALRALFNHFAASLYADVNVFTEHPVIELGHGIGPFYKPSDEAKFLVWLRAFLLREEGESLHLAMGVPKAWFAPGQSFTVTEMASFFGPVTYRVQSSSAQVIVEVKTPERRPPQELVVHVRRSEGQTIQEVMVNGIKHTDFDAERELVRIVAPIGQLLIQTIY
jgi:hypothetical protein